MAPSPADPGAQPTTLAASVDVLRRALERFRILIAVLALILFGAAYVGGLGRTARDLGVAGLPNVIATLLVFIVVTGFYRFAGISQTDQTAHLLDEQRLQIIADLAAQSAGPPGPVVAFHPIWAEISTDSWRAFVGDAQRIDVVMNWSDSLFESHIPAFRSAIRGRAKFCLWLPDPGLPIDGATLSDEDRRRMEGLGSSYGLNYRYVRFHIANSVTKLIEIGARPEDISVRLLRRLAYSVVRVDGERLMLSNFDQFRVDHPRASAFVLDLSANTGVKEYWGDQFEKFEAVPPTSTQRLLELRVALGQNGH